jgi:two-component sensor histidine kinase
VRWSFTADGHESPLRVEWEERDGPQVVAPIRSGLGTGIICELIPYELGGRVEHVYRSEGVRCKLKIPATWLSASKRPWPNSFSPGQPPGNRPIEHT